MGMNVVDFAQQIFEMQHTIRVQEHEILRLKGIEENYNALFDSSVKHSDVMFSNLLELCMTPGVIEACQNAARRVASTTVSGGTEQLPGVLCNLPSQWYQPVREYAAAAAAKERELADKRVASIAAERDHWHEKATRYLAGLPDTE